MVDMPQRRTGQCGNPWGNPPPALPGMGMTGMRSLPRTRGLAGTELGTQARLSIHLGLLGWSTMNSRDRITCQIQLRVREFNYVSTSCVAALLFSTVECSINESGWIVRSL